MNENPDDDKSLEPQFKERLSDDLKALFEPASPDWSGMDRAVMDRAYQALSPIRKQRRLYWPAAAAAAAAIGAGVLFMSFWHDKPAGPLPMAARLEDVDRNGRVDILDAFQLAKMVQSSTATDSMWDMNRDGTVNQLDVEVVAKAAVHLGEDVL
jgi:hypothetical protein